MNVHVIPLLDLIPHRQSAECECQPFAEEIAPDGTLYTHHAKDGRDIRERFTGKAASQFQQWEVTAEPSPARAEKA